MCTEKLAFVDYLRAAQKKHWYRIGVCVDTQKATSYLVHLCARKVGVFASIRNLDLKMKITKVFHAFRAVTYII